MALLDAIKVEEIKSVRLVDALLCADCDTIYCMSTHIECPSCAGKHYVKLVSILQLIEPERFDKPKDEQIKIEPCNNFLDISNSSML